MESRQSLPLILAFEWLTLLGSLFFGLIILSILYPQDSEKHVAHRKTLYEKLTKEYQSLHSGDIFDRLSRERFDPSTARKLDTFVPDVPPPPPPKPFRSFDQFSKALDNPQNRKVFYDSVSARFDIGSWEIFDHKIAPPSSASRVLSFSKSLVSRDEWADSWLLLFSFYLFVQIIRSVYVSVKVIRRHRSQSI